MINKILDTIKKHNMLEKNDNIVLGLSGGSDSVSLFHIFRELREIYNLNITAVHINHSLRDEADSDEKFCIELCKKYDIPIFTYKIDIEKMSREKKITTEEAGRFARYEHFNKHIKSSKDKIAVAHNKNDVVETFFMRLLRGSGLRGLGSISPTHDNIIRPLIEIEKNEIEKFCFDNNFEFVFDKSNLSTKYTRNKIRQNLIPQLKEEYNPEILNTIYKTSKIIFEEDSFLETLSIEHFNKLGNFSKNKLNLEIEGLKKLDIVLIRRILRYAIYKLNSNLKNLSHIHIDDCINLLESKNGTTISLPENIFVSKNYEYLCIFLKEEKKEQVSKEIKVELNTMYLIEETDFYFSATLFDFPPSDYKNHIISPEKNLKCLHTKETLVPNINNLVLRNRLSSDKIYFRHINGNKKIKKYFIDEKIPREERDKILLLTDNNNNVFLIFDRHLKIADENYGTKVYFKIWEVL